MRDLKHNFVMCLLLGTVQVSLQAQSNEHVVAPSPTDAHSIQLEQKVEAISSELVVTRQQLEQSQQQIRELQEELSAIKKMLSSASPSTVPSPGSVDGAAAARATAAEIEDLQERQQTLEAQVKVHEQTKLESASKYPLHVTGLILFNAFENRGNVDNIDLPAYALTPTNNAGNGSGGASFRQTILGIEGSGPQIAGGRTSADINIDFFGGLVTGNIGTAAGVVRMRTASINLDWTNDSLQFGMVGPLISPLSPTSYASVAEAPMGGAGNLWTWAPQVRFAHRIPLQRGNHLQVEFGLWDPPTASYNSTSAFRVAGPGERSKQPAYESRVSYGTSAIEHGFQLGVSGYYSRQDYPYGDRLDSWAGTADWRIPISRRFEISGEGYRGRALGGLGGGTYKDVLYGTDPVTGVSSYRGLNAIGGWTQFKSRFGRSLEANASIGLDDGFAADFHTLVFAPTATAGQLLARNKMVIGNLIFRPKTYLLFSPEYRRIWTWPIYGAASTANIFTLSAGYQF
jgi:hypothetical protein